MKPAPAPRDPQLRQLADEARRRVWHSIAAIILKATGEMPLADWLRALIRMEDAAVIRHEAEINARLILRYSLAALSKAPADLDLAARGYLEEWRAVLQDSPRPPRLSRPTVGVVGHA